ncbi:MAG: DUF1295 domain-containing protein [candidate division Zixibacteria bacterium]|nr:DUF1295 domain-containing protein [candidate division Zixibacteria bacterium]
MFAIVLYQIGFALLGASESQPIDIIDIGGIALYLVGSFLNTGAEFQRKKFKDRPENKGRLYTDGLFGYARHINYFGDTLWVSGWAILTRNYWSILIPIFITSLFIFAFIPSISKYLASKYGEQYDAWKKKTKAFVPFVYLMTNFIV